MPVGKDNGSVVHEEPKIKGPCLFHNSWGIIRCLALTASIYMYKWRQVSFLALPRLPSLLILLTTFRLMMSTIATIYLSFIISTRSVIALDPNATVSGKSITQNLDLKQGWTPGPDGRGTLDIIWSCGVTMVLCSWSILCMNMPGPKES